MLAYMVCNFCHACCDVCVAEMNGVIVEVVDAKMALGISLSCLIQWVFCGLVVEESLEGGEGLSPVSFKLGTPLREG